MAGKRKNTVTELVTIETRISEDLAERLRLLAAENERSLAAELRLAVTRHLEAAA